MWVKTAPVDPNLPIRGRYVSLRLEGHSREPVAFFIPEHVPYPSRRSPGEELWIEVSVQRKGMLKQIKPKDYVELARRTTELKRKLTALPPKLKAVC